jgi:putative transposase
MRRVCRILRFSRARLRARAVSVKVPTRLDEVLVERLRRLIERYPTFGYRRLWALLCFGEGLRVNRKAVYRILKLKRWFVHQRVATPRPRVQGHRSRAPRSNERWAMDLRHVPCGADGWGHLTAVNDCHDREVPGFEFALRGRAKEAERALEEACLARFGTLPPGFDAGAAKRQWPDFSKPAFSRCLPRLPPTAGVHHALHPRAERPHRTLLSQPQRRVCLAA